jgi:hypothetical protein
MYGLGGYCRPHRAPAAGERPALDATWSGVVRIHSDIWPSIHAKEIEYIYDYLIDTRDRWYDSSQTGPGH